MRQAYDYWQDQPGNCFPTAEVTFTCCKHPVPTLPHQSGKAFQGGCLLQGPNAPHTQSALWSVAVMLGLPQQSVQAPTQQAMGTPYPLVSQALGTDLPVYETRITAFSEDYHGPAAPARHTAVQVDLQVVI